MASLNSVPNTKSILTLLCPHSEYFSPHEQIISLSRLSASAAKRNCQLCVVLHAAVQKAPVIFLKDSVIYSFGKFGHPTLSSGSTLTIRLYNPTRKYSRYTQQQIYALPVQSDPSGKSLMRIPQSHLGPGNIESEACIAQSLSWLRDCQETHTECRASKSVPLLPTRVIEINSTGAHIVKLAVTAGKRAKYLCLSHCWGRTQPIRTTKATLSAMSTNIPWSHLPKTFREAIDFTRKLGYRYLWIDSLCIIQDDKEDWNIEAMRMASVYQNCDLCLAATASPDSSAGLAFKEPSVSPDKLCDFESNGCQYEVFMREGLHHLFSHDWLGLIAKSYEFPLLKRGWVFQERLLAPSILHFGSHELLWECLRLTTCECGNPDLETASKITYEPSKCSKTELPYHWRNLVKAYSRLQLTDANDILPALAGIAKHWTSYREGTYLAGCWKDSLLQDILWSRALSVKPTSHLSLYTAPSWSWASGPGIIQFHHSFQDNPSFRPFSTVVDCSVANVNDDATGRVLSGFLTLKGPWFRSIEDITAYNLKIGECKTPQNRYCSFWLVLKQVKADPPQYGRYDLKVSEHVESGEDPLIHEVSVMEDGVFTII